MNTTGPQTAQFLEHGLRAHALNRVKETAFMFAAGALFVAAILAIHFAGQSGSTILTGAGWVVAVALIASGVWVLVARIWIPLIAHLRSLTRSTT